MNDWLIVVLTWVGFSPILGIAMGKFLGRADELARTGGDRSVNLRRPAALPILVANQVVAAKPAGPYRFSRTS